MLSQNQKMTTEESFWNQLKLSEELYAKELNLTRSNNLKRLLKIVAEEQKASAKEELLDAEETKRYRAAFFAGQTTSS